MFKKDQNELLKSLSGDLLDTYISTGHDLTATTTDFFVKYFESEMTKENQRSTYPYKLWTTIFRKNSELKYQNFLEKVGFVRPGTNIFAKDYCEDLTVLRSRIDNFRKFYNYTENMQVQNGDFDKIDYYHISQYF